jgi:hypothetical protein
MFPSVTGSRFPTKKFRKVRAAVSIPASAILAAQAGRAAANSPAGM